MKYRERPCEICGSVHPLTSDHVVKIGLCPSCGRDDAQPIRLNGWRTCQWCGFEFVPSVDLRQARHVARTNGTEAESEHAHPSD